MSGAKRRREGSPARAPWTSWPRRLTEDRAERPKDVLKSFDLNLKFGPCLGITRYERWLRASDLGLDPPRLVIELLSRAPNPSVLERCLWD